MYAILPIHIIFYIDFVILVFNIYSVVEITKDYGVHKKIVAVPSLWLISNDKCAWPKTENKSILNKLIENNTPYTEICFYVFSSRVLQTNIGI